MGKLTIVIGNKNYSSWSLRGWLALKLCTSDFEEIVIPLDQPDTQRRIREHSPSGKVPTLIDGPLTVWDSLAIGEYLAEKYPPAGLWPSDARARAHARAIVAEMHAGFAPLRRHFPMDMRSRLPDRGRGAIPEEVVKDVARIETIWRETLTAFGGAGGFLFDRPGLADAFYAPVASRFATYGLTLGREGARYRDRLLDWEPVNDWFLSAEAEAWVIG